MNIFKIDPKDLLRSKTVQPGWYVASVKKVEQRPAKTDGSINTIVSFVIEGGNFDGVPIDHTFSEKAPGFAIPFVSAMCVMAGGAPIRSVEDLNASGYDFDKAVGMKVRIEVYNDSYQGRLTNKIKDWQPAT